MNSVENILGKYFRFLETKGKTFNIILGVISTAIVSILDTLAPQEVSFSFLYMFPIAFVTWYGGKKAGFIISLVCAAIWSIDTFVTSIIISTINIISTFAIFMTISIMISKMHEMWRYERILSRTDHLTGVMNLRAFTELVEYEILRLQRENTPFSIAYLDLDNFKMVNDLYGHKKGDALLKSIIKHLIDNLRKTDVVARVGGDEFTIFLPATDHVAAKIVMDKVQEQMQILAEKEKWITTFSVGVLTCTNGECEFEDIISIADKLMYEVKNSGKNNIRYSILH